jgi:hypothetical protein
MQTYSDGLDTTSLRFDGDVRSSAGWVLDNAGTWTSVTRYARYQTLHEPCTPFSYRCLIASRTSSYGQVPVFCASLIRHPAG